MTTEAELPPDAEIGPHEHEPHHESTSALLNWLRAAVLGANDGIVSVAGLVMGVAGATDSRHTLFIAGAAGLVSGALSMAAGEYVSVSTQRDTEQALIAKERQELEDDPEDELAELAGIYRDKGLSESLAIQVAEELTAHDALAAHADAELGIDPDELTSPWQAAVASLISFVLGAALPLLTITLFSESSRIWATVVAVVLALALTGFASARFAEADVRRAMIRNVVGGLLAMAVTYGIGSVVGGVSST
ncbi:VIT family protein [Nocardioides marmoriginsengisoli]|uniref:VIT family protein n=1 Tax=Nocardioides marmoriginsengisoli TaxID=661483 RepID=A0A3N0CAT9_9ACTN|nr:VIT family protein [Nocardioides marmoriginsengisoli]RNL60575.1 VIT family protein [Nocardioides marmoriginsengisoli]